MNITFQGFESQNILTYPTEPQIKLPLGFMKHFMVIFVLTTKNITSFLTNYTKAINEVHIQSGLSKNL